MSGSPEDVNRRQETSSPQNVGPSRAWHWFTVLSLDAPLVSMVWQRTFAQELKLSLPWIHSLLLGAVVWLIYTADRWFEASRLPTATLHLSRHAFHARHLKLLGALMPLVACGVLGTALHTLSLWEWRAGAVLVVATAAYVLSHQGWHRERRFRIPKEFCVALLFTAGTLLAPTSALVTTGEHLLQNLKTLALPASGFASLCLVNLCLISLFEARADRLQGQRSLATEWSGLERSLSWFSASLALALAAGLLLPPTLLSRPLAAALLVGLALLEGLRRNRGRLHPETLRTLADLALLSPLLFTWT